MTLTPIESRTLKTCSDLRKLLGRKPTQEEVADRLGVSPKTARLLYDRATRKSKA